MNWFYVGVGVALLVCSGASFRLAFRPQIEVSGQPSPNVQAIIDEVKNGADDWETTNYNDYFSYFYSPSRNLLFSARPSFKPGDNDEYILSVGRIDSIRYDRWWSSDSWKGTNNVGGDDGRILLREITPYLKKAKLVVKTYPDKLDPIVSSKGEKPKTDRW